MRRIRAILFCGFGLLLAACSEELAKEQAPAKIQDSSAVPPLQDYGSIGGDFSLVDQYGELFELQALRGRSAMLFFGYTYCPDICPTNLLVMSHAVDMLGDVGEKVQPIFVTVDPGRDTVDSLAEYVQNFHPRLKGLTGSEAEILVAAEAYKVYFKRGEDNETPDDYPVEHTEIIYFMGADGNFLDHFQRDLRPAEIAQLMEQYL